MPQKNHGSQMKGNKQYEGSRQQGVSEEKISARSGQSERYEEWTKDELYNKAKEAGIGGRSSMSKAELIRALRHH